MTDDAAGPSASRFGTKAERPRAKVVEQKERQAAGNAAYWDSFWDADQVSLRIPG